MAVTILFVDLRTDPSNFAKFVVEWAPDLSARASVQQALGEAVTFQIVNDLNDNNEELTVSWLNKTTEEHSEIGGVNSLDWNLPDASVVAIVYENQTTTQDKIDASVQWMLNNE